MPPRQAFVASRSAFAAAAGLAASLAAACADAPPPTDARVGPVRLRVTAAFDAAAAGRQVDVSVFYARRSGERVTLAAERFDVDTGVRVLPVTVDVGPCLRDPERGGSGGCPVAAAVTLRDAARGVIDSALVGPVSVTGTSGDPVALPTAVLRRTASIRLGTGALRVHVGDTISALATPLDAGGTPLPGRPLAWTSADPRVATVSAAGVVTGVSVGTTTLRAEREGLSVTVPLTVPITGVQRWVVSERLGTEGRGDPVVGTVVAVVAPPGGDPVAFASSATDVCRHVRGSWSCALGVGVSPVSSVYGVHARSATDVWFAGSNRVWRWNGTSGQDLPVGTNDFYYGVWAADDGSVFAAGFGGATARYDGRSWSTTPRGTTATLYGIWGSSPRNVIAVGDSGVVMRFDGTAWRRTQIPEQPWLRAVWGADSTHVYAAGFWGSLWMFDGATWRALPAGGFWDATAVHGTGPNDVYVAAQVDSQQVLMRWNGSAWTRLGRVPVVTYRVHAVGDGRVLLGGIDGYVGVYESGTITTLSRYPEYRRIAVTSRDHAVVGSANRFFAFDGAAWRQMPLPWPDPFVGSVSDIAATGPRDVFAAVYQRPETYLLHFDGTGWRRAATITVPPANVSGSVLALLGTNDVLAARWRWDGARYHTSLLRCSRAGCSAFAPEHPFYLHSIWASSPTNVFVSGYDVVYNSASNTTSATAYLTLRFDGREWRRIDLPPNATTGTRSLWGPDSTTVLLRAFGTANTVLRYDYAAGQWTPLPGTSSVGSAVWGTAFDDLYSPSCGRVTRFDGRRSSNMAVNDNRCVLSIDGLRTGGALATMQGSLIVRGIGPDGTFGAGISALARAPFGAGGAGTAGLVGRNDAPWLAEPLMPAGPGPAGMAPPPPGPHRP